MNPHVRVVSALLSLALLVIACVGSDSPTRVHEGDGLVGLAIQPALIPSAADGSAAPINRIRAVTVRVPDNVVLDVTVVDVSPTRDSWDLVLAIPASGDEPVVVVVFLYLINAPAGGTESVEFSGRSEPITLVEGEEISPVTQIVRGPIENLFVTGVTITSAPATMVAGGSQALSATSDPAESTVFWTSLDPSVLTMEGSTATAVAAGTAQVVASAGAFSDTASVTVYEPLAVTTASLPEGTVNLIYSATLTAAGGDGSYTWSIATGSLPAGLSLIGSTISGTPTGPSGTFTVEVASGDAQTTTRQLTIRIFPTIVRVDPNSGAMTGGTATTITGTAFQAGATVSVGGARAVDVSVVNSTTITASTPPGAAGSADVVVANPDGGTATQVGGFTYGGLPLLISPPQAEKLPGGTQQFTVTQGATGPFTWSVNGVTGGDATFGTITTDGFYQAPSVVPSPSTFAVCAVDSPTGASVCAEVTIQPIPTAGEDVVVFNDFNLFHNLAMDFGAGATNNPILVQNLVSFSSSGPRNAGTKVWWDIGRSSRCATLTDEACTPANFSTMASVIENAGLTIETVSSEAGTLTDIPTDVKLIFLWNPTVAYTVVEINALKRFAAEGGRAVFVGEYDGFYGTWIPIENQFLKDMGAEMVNIGSGVDCNQYFDLPASSLRAHQITQGMSAVRIACASVIQPGPNDFAFLYDSSNTFVLAGVAKIDVTPLPLDAPLPSSGLGAAPASLGEATIGGDGTGAGTAPPGLRRDRR